MVTKRVKNQKSLIKSKFFLKLVSPIMKTVMGNVTTVQILWKMNYSYNRPAQDRRGIEKKKDDKAASNVEDNNKDKDNKSIDNVGGANCLNF